MKATIPVLSLVLTLFVTACTRPPPPPEPIRPLRVMEVGVVEDLRNAQIPGRARSANEVDLAFDVSGTLIERPVSIGTVVSEGDLIARLNPADFQANLRAAEAEARNAERNFARGKELLSDRFISESEFDRLEARVDITQAQLALARQALSDSEIYAPFDGIIANLFVENFQSVPAKKVIARLLGYEKVEMVVNVSENQIRYLPFIESIEVEYDAFPGIRLPAEITEVGTEASLTTRTFPITLSMNQPTDKKILAGMAGVAHIIGRAPGENTGGYVIPISAFKGNPQSNQSRLWVVGEDNRVSSREVTVGRVTDGGILVTEGLQAGDLIATAGVHVLSEGQEVIVNRTGG